MPILFAHFVMMQLPWMQAGQLLLVVGISFAAITLLYSTARFHHMFQLGEDELKSTGDGSDFFYIQVTRYLSKITRTSRNFTVLLIQLRSETADRQALQEQILNKLKQIIRTDRDTACLCSTDCTAVLFDTDSSHTQTITERLTRSLTPFAAKLSPACAIRTGFACFPKHAKNSSSLINAAENALKHADFCKNSPDQPAHDLIERKADLPESSEERTFDEKNPALDPLTGVLKPELISPYMRKHMANLHHEKKPVTLLCLRINRIDGIIRLHGPEAADEVICRISTTIKALTRPCDLIGRYRQSDFSILTPCSLKQGEEIANRLRDTVLKQVFRINGKPIKTSVSIGLASHPQHGRSLRDLFRGAYAALETIDDWNTSSCLVYDPAKHNLKENHAPTT